jgi:hypothetical protein
MRQQGLLKMDKLRELERSMELISKFHGEFAFDYLEANTDLLKSTNQEQMYQGLDADGKPIRPRYSEDPYFESPVLAWIYARWKNEISPHPKRDIDTPNLFITGAWYYEPLRVFRYHPKEIRFTNTHAQGKKIYAKYPTSLGITPDNMEELNQTEVKPYVIHRVIETLK